MDKNEEFRILMVEALLATISMQFIMLDTLKWKDQLDDLPEDIRNQIPIVLDSVKETASKLGKFI